MPPLYKIFATTIPRSGYEPGRGLENDLDGIFEPLSIPLQNFLYGVGYALIEEELFEAEMMKEHECDIRKPIPELYQ